MLLICILLSFLFSAIFYAAEEAFESFSKLRFELDRKQKNLIYFILGRFYKRPGLFLMTLRLGKIITLVLFLMCMIEVTETSLHLSRDSDIGVLLLESLFMLLLILFGIMFIPQSIGKANPYFSLIILAIPLYIIYVLLLPFSLLSMFIFRLLSFVFGLKDVQLNERKTGKEDLDSFIQSTIEQASENTELETEVKIFQNALDFSRIRLKDCMIPRTEIVALDIQVSKRELLSKFIETGLSKILIYSENIDDITGYIHSTEMFAGSDEWKEKIKPVSIVPETMAANKLMKVLMQEKRSIAVVVDEFGGISGIVTLEDLVEEIFGDFEDEHDVNSYVAQKKSDTEYIFSGRMEIDKVNELFDLELPESDNYQTVAGLILHVCQKFPQPNEIIHVGDFSFIVIKKTSTKIELVRMKIVKK